MFIFPNNCTNYPSGQYPSSNGQGGYPGGAQNGYPKPSGTFAGPSVQPGSFPGAQQAGGFPGQGSQPGQGGFSGQGGQPSSFPEGGAFPGQGPSDGQYEGGDYSAIPGEPDKDYPILSYIPETSFKCDQQQYPGYYADVETRCQVFHVCSNNRTYDFLCPNGTIFHQEYLVCVWWNQFDCNLAPSLFGINANIYDYSIIGAQQAQGGYQPGQGFGGYPQGGFPTGPGTEQGPGAPGGGYPGERPQRPGVSSGVPQASGGYPSSSTPTGPGGDTGYPGGRPQGPQIPNQGYEPGYPGGRLQSPGTNGAQQSTTGGYPSGGAQGGYPSGRPTQGPGGYPGQTGFPTQQQRPGTGGQQAGYPGGRPEGPSFPPSGQGSEPQRPTGSQGQGGYPSGANGAQRPGYPGQSTTNGYPSGRPQGPAFPTASQNGGYQRPGGQETQQGGYPQGAVFPSTVEPGVGGDTTQGPAGGSYPGGRPGTPFPGTQQPNREYLPPF
uniref:Cuticular protein analogous to peritrophins 1-L n=1 Tax=Leptinotarsa decemlineata TaxID=7539 RepID=A0A3Q8HFX7_LEPDE|nr:cuticular protein analogous to peritrophins 1-L [Leptinotarsa decemlineata]